ncbi:MAG: DUF3187 family protein, partial [Longimicrobiales bacterium]|nr:DUF3187 family protein [Longimicrobiales bacterium]
MNRPSPNVVATAPRVHPASARSAVRSCAVVPVGSALGALLTHTLALLFTLPAALTAQALPAGPLPVAEQNPLYRFQHAPETEPVDVVEKGALDVELITAYSNVFEKSSSSQHVHLFDLEQMTNTLGARYGVGASWETGVELTFHTGWGGFLDGFVSGFHNAFGFPNGGRETEPAGQHEVRLTGMDPEVDLSLSRRTLDLEGAAVFAKWQPFGGDRGPYGLSIRGTLRTSAGPLESGRVDAALSLLGRMSGRGEFEGTHFYGSATFLRLDPVSSLEPIFRESAMAFTLAFERGLTSGVAGIVQLSAGTPYVDAWGESRLSRFPSTLTFGIADRGEGEWGWRFGFTEDFPPESPTVDFTVN